MTVQTPHSLSARPPDRNGGRTTLGYARVKTTDPELADSLYRLVDHYCSRHGYSLGEWFVDYATTDDSVDVPSLDKLVLTVGASGTPSRVVVPSWSDLGTTRQVQDDTVDALGAVGAVVEVVDPARPDPDHAEDDSAA